MKFKDLRTGKILTIAEVRRLGRPIFFPRDPARWTKEHMSDEFLKRWDLERVESE